MSDPMNQPLPALRLSDRNVKRVGRNDKGQVVVFRLPGAGKNVASRRELHDHAAAADGDGELEEILLADAIAAGYVERVDVELPLSFDDPADLEPIDDAE